MRVRVNKVLLYWQNFVEKYLARPKILQKF